MTMTTCGCGADTTADGATVCTGCAAGLRVDLRHVPWLRVELDTTATRQGARPVHGAGRSATTPLPWDERAADVLRALTGKTLSLIHI